jgi:hypothetical protein
LEIKMRNSVSAALLGLLLMEGSVAAAEAASEQFLTGLPSDALPINENYYNQSVYDRQDNDIGDLNDIVLDKEGKVSAVIIGVGGFLGAGEKNVAVPFNALKVTEKEGKTYLVVDTTKEALEKAPAFTFDRAKRQWVPAAKAQ